MQRSRRNKPTPAILKLMEESIDLRLYLVAQKGPLSFIFQDDHSQKFSINIGKEISCSCTMNKKDNKEHCVHTFYLLNRIFKISFSDPFILQIQFSDVELDKMVENRKKALSTKCNKSNNNRSKDNNLSINDSFEEEETEKKMNLLDDITCSICQDYMYEAEGLYVCEDSCKHNFHLDCIKVLAISNKSNNIEILKCPLCREVWNEETVKMKIVKGMVNREKLKVHHGIDCSNCERKNIKGERFHCLLCENYDMCIECFNLNIHKKFHLSDESQVCEISFPLKENSLILRIAPDQIWQSFEKIIQKNENHKKYNIKPIKLQQYLISLFDYFDERVPQINIVIHDEKNENENSHDVENEENKENINENQEDDPNDNLVDNDKTKNKINLKCFVCRKLYSNNRYSGPQINRFIRIPKCGHLAHNKCIEQIFKIHMDKAGSVRIDENFNICKFDNLNIFPGLKTLKFNIYQINDDQNLQTTNKNNNELNKNQSQKNVNNKTNNNQNNANGCFLYNSNNPNQNNQNVNNNFTTQKNKVYNVRQLSNRIGNIKNPLPEIFDTAMQINNYSSKVTPLSGNQRSTNGRLLAPINTINLNGPNKKNNMVKNTISSGEMIGLAINIQKVNFDEENKVQNYEKNTQEKLMENYSNRKFYSSRRLITAINKITDKKHKELSLPELKVINNKYNNSDLNDLELINESNEKMAGFVVSGKPFYPTVKRTINKNNIGIKISPLLNDILQE